MDEMAAMLLVLCALGAIGFSVAALLFLSTPIWPVSLWFFAIAVMFGWLASRVFRGSPHA